MAILRGDDQIRRALKSCRTVAVIGASPDPFRPSYYVPEVVRGYGIKVCFVNPKYAGEYIQGERVYPSLRDVPEKVDIVDVFRRPSAAFEVAEEVMAKGCSTVWFQPGTENSEVAEALSEEGYDVVLGSCMKVECRRLL